MEPNTRFESLRLHEKGGGSRAGWVGRARAKSVKSRIDARGQRLGAARL